jgi:hypothetical protein
LISRIAYDLHKFNDADTYIQPVADYILTHESTIKEKNITERPIFDKASAKRANLLFGSAIKRNSMKCSSNMCTEAILGVDPAAIFCLAGMISRYRRASFFRHL